MPVKIQFLKNLLEIRLSGKFDNPDECHATPQPGLTTPDCNPLNS